MSLQESAGAATCQRVDGAKHAGDEIQLPWDLPVDVRERLLRRATVTVLPRGGVVWDEGRTSRTFTVVLRGRVKLLRARPDGHQSILDTAGPARLLCTRLPLCLAAYCCRAESMVDGTRVLSIPRLDMLRVFEEHPEAAIELLEQTAEAYAAMCHRVEELTAGRVAQRLAKLVDRLADEVGVVDGGVVRVPVRFSRQELADLTGTTVESAIRVMTQLERDGVVRTVRAGFVVEDRDRLSQVAAGEM